VIVAGPSGTIATTGFAAPVAYAGHALAAPSAYGLGYAAGLPYSTYGSLAYAAPHYGTYYGKRSADAEPGYGGYGYGGRSYGRYGKREAEPGYGGYGYGGRSYGRYGKREAEPGYGGYGYGGRSYGGYGRYGKREAEAEPKAEADVIVAGPSGTIATTGFAAPIAYAGHALAAPSAYGLGYAAGLPYSTYGSLAYAAPHYGTYYGKRSADAEPGYGGYGYGGRSYGRYGKREAEPGYGGYGYGGRSYGRYGKREAEPGYGGYGYGGRSYGSYGRYGKREAEAEPKAEADVIVAGPSGTIATTGFAAPVAYAGHALAAPSAYGLGYAAGLPYSTYGSLAYAAPHYGTYYGKRSADAEPGYGGYGYGGRSYGRYGKREAEPGYGGYGYGGRSYGRYGKREAEPGYGRSGYGGYGRGGRYYG